MEFSEEALIGTLMKGLGRIGSFPLLLLGITLLVSLPSDADASRNAEVKDIRFWSYPAYTRVVISLGEEVDFTSNRLSHPDRLFFDLKGSRINRGIKKNIAVGNEMLKSVRTSQFDAETVRVVLDLEKITDYKINTLEDPVRIVIDIFGTVTLSAKKRIVIDPGHGGHDPGAVGPNNLFEKDVVLDIALKLRTILSADQNYEVFLTRDRDVFLPLEERTAIANSRNADLFVSIHANASPHRTAKGVETYMLNWTNNEEAMRVAARENAISLKKMRQMNKKEEMDILGMIKNDLYRENKRDESIKLAHYIQNNVVSDLNRHYNHVVDLGVKQALFFVLFGAKMPSVLVEVSFISNPLEEKLLSRDDYRSNIARSISSGITTYMSKAPEGQTVAGFRKDLVP